MLSNINEDGDSFLHSADPRFKIAAFIPLVFLIAVSKNFSVVLLSLALALTLTLLTKPGYLKLLKQLTLVNVFIIFIWLSLPLTLPLNDGLRLAMLITLKTNTIFLLSFSLLGTSDILSVAHALSHLKVPRKLVYLFFFFYQYLSLLFEEYQRLSSALKLRSFNGGVDLRSLKTFSYLAGIVFIRSYERSQKVYQSLLLRGFKGYLPMLQHFDYRRSDILFLILMLGFTVSLLAL